MSLRITLASSPESWIGPSLDILERRFVALGHEVRRVQSADCLAAGDLCFLLGCGFLVSREALGLHRHNLVVHESALPLGRGWSPLTWQILEGASEIPITLFEAAEEVDAGRIYLQDTLRFEGHELVDELRSAQAAATLELCERFVREFPTLVAGAVEQAGAPSFYPRRRPEDSRLDVHKSLAEQFDLLRVADSERYPAFFDHQGHRYVLALKRLPEEETP